jgi:plasmid stabilization system protein ParE
MRYEIFWLANAKVKLNKIYKFILDNWNIRIADEFINKLKYKLQILSYFPHIGQKSQKKKDVRRYIISEQVSLFYKIEKKKIIILTLFDTRQNPDKLKY